MNLIIAGHSVSHYRQRMLGETTAKLGIKTIAIGPLQWGIEKYESYKKKRFIFRAFPIAGAPSFYSFTFKKLNRVISGFRPATIYCMEEPFTLFARECMRYAKEYQCSFSFFTWENRPDYRLGEPYNRLEQDVIREADRIICGNKLAKKRMINCGAEKEKLAVLLQSGIDTDLFKPDEKIKKEYDVIYHGRLVREKGLYFLETVCKKLGIKLLTVGGRGQYHVKYGDAKEWTDYENLPEIVNSARIGVQFPFSWQGYQEQGNFSIGENMAVGNPVVISNNGSLPDNYGGAPIPMVDEGDEEKLKEEIKKLLMMEDDERKKLGRDCRKWITGNLSLEVVGKQLLEILELI